jgi:hypothetical protein
MGAGMTDLTALPWRQGRTLGRTVYARTGGDDWKADTAIGMLDTPELAAAACEAHNATLGLPGEAFRLRQNATASPYRCPTPCDEDCEINGWGCHEAHGMPAHREHDPAPCEALMLAGNLRWLLNAGWRVTLGRYQDRSGALEPWFARLVSARRDMPFLDGASPGDVAAKAVEWSRREGVTP